MNSTLNKFIRFQFSHPGRKRRNVADYLDLIIEANILTLADARPRVAAVGVKNGVIASSVIVRKW